MLSTCCYEQDRPAPPHNSAQRSPTKALIAFAEEVGAQIIAEGVEEQSELEVLRDLGVDWVQNYLVGRLSPFLTATPVEPRHGLSH